jgi:ribosomal-protein-alanine N-acetyltransferase
MHDIDAQTSQYPRSEESYAACCQGGSTEQVLVWDRDGEVCGFIVYSAVLDQASIHNIAICPVLQRQGVGRALLGACLAAMRNSGFKTCLLEVRASNAAALGLYRDLGFAADGRRRNYYRGPSGREDALLMSLAL